MKLHQLGFAVAGLLAASTLVAADGAALWEERCAKCHGSDGRARTRLGRKLKIRSLADPAVQAEFTDAQAAMAIHDGVADNPGKVRMETIKGLSDEQVQALIKYLRSLKK